MEKKSAKLVFYAVFLLYLSALLWILFNRSRYLEGIPYWQQVRQYVNLQPFHTIRLYLRMLFHPSLQVHTSLAWYNLLGNILMFLPMGALVPMVFPRFRSFFRTMALALGFIILVEIVQVLLLAGSCDIDDVILNLLGCALGYPFRQFLIP